MLIFRHLASIEESIFSDLFVQNSFRKFNSPRSALTLWGKSANPLYMYEPHLILYPWSLIGKIIFRNV